MNMAAVLFHKNPISARLRLLRFSDGGVIGPDRPTEIGEVEGDDLPIPHPGVLLSELRDRLNMSADELHPYAAPIYWMGDVAIFAVECTALEPPQKLAEKLDGEWIDFTAVRALGPEDQQAARTLYTHAIG